MRLDFHLCIETVTGKLVNPSDPSPEDIELNDIAWALSRLPRFAGHTISAVPHTVAQHSIYVSELVEKLLDHQLDVALTNQLFHEGVNLSEDVDYYIILKALLHDAHEAYLGDIPSPIKKIPELKLIFKNIEDRLDIAIFEKLNILPMTIAEKKVIKLCDKLAQAIEAYQYMPSRGLQWDLPKPSLIIIQSFPAPLPTLDSYNAFLQRYNQLDNCQP